VTRSRERWVSPGDLRLLGELAREPNVVRAARRLGIGRDRAVYRLRRLGELFGGPVVRGSRGGPAGGGSRLTPLGHRLLRRATGPARPTNRWTGTYRRTPAPHVVLGPDAELEVTFAARDGARVTIEVDPEAFVVARRRVDLSARNALPVAVERVRRGPGDSAILLARWDHRRVRVALTPASVASLGLSPGTSAFLYAKAVAIRHGLPSGS
jgi:molybdate transport repressor ModE-like protein